MSARSEGIEAFDRGDEMIFDNPYPWKDKKHHEWVDGFLFSQKIELEIELPEFYGESITTSHNRKPLFGFPS